jgi:hypothetical protein
MIDALRAMGTEVVEVGKSPSGAAQGQDRGTGA